MRFAIGLREFSEKKGGAERYLVDLCRRMAFEGHEVHVYAEHRDSEDSEIHFHPVKTIRFPKSLRLLSLRRGRRKRWRKGITTLLSELETR